MRDFWRGAAAVAICILAYCSRLSAQHEHMLALTGAEGIEELDESVTEKYEALARHPVKINTSSLTSLVSCGLFTAFQAAALDDWRRSSGDILSLTELGLIDGFNPALVSHLAPYIDLSSKAGIGRSSTDHRSTDEAVARLQRRRDEGSSADSAWGFKYRHISDNRGSICAAVRSSYGQKGMSPDTWSASGMIQGRGLIDRIIVGDFNARFGQGLAMWSGFSMSGTGTVDAFCKRATGISPTWSYGATSYRGAAAILSRGRWTASGMIALPGLRTRMEGGRADVGFLPAADISWLGKRSQFSITGYAHSAGEAKISADARLHVRSIDLYGEAALDAVTGAVAGIGGLTWTPGWQHSFAIMARAYPASYSPGQAGSMRAGSKVTDENGITLGLRIPWLSLTSDFAVFPSRGGGQMKVVALSDIPLSGNLAIAPRITFRVKDRTSRTDLRADCRWTSGPWNVTIRSNWLRQRAWARLHYGECGYRSDRIGLWMRATIFRIDNWDDRIYVYERDAPGSFNVPAYYGRGYAASAVCSRKWGKSKLHLRASAVHYTSDKPARVELKCQYSIQL